MERNELELENESLRDQIDNLVDQVNILEDENKKLKSIINELQGYAKYFQRHALDILKKINGA